MIFNAKPPKIERGKIKALQGNKLQEARAAQAEEVRHYVHEVTCLAEAGPIGNSCVGMVLKVKVPVPEPRKVKKLQESKLGEARAAVAEQTRPVLDPDRTREENEEARSVDAGPIGIS